jgi:hypothetical protein
MSVTHACSLTRTLAGLLALVTATTAYTPASESVARRSTAVAWPDPAFAPERQCRGRYPTEDLQRFLPRARVAMWLPSTRAVRLDTERRCITVVVDSKGAGRLAELVMRGVAVPRGAVLLRLSTAG